MITAKEAREMTGVADVNVKLALTMIERDVKEAAAKGDTSVFHKGMASYATESKGEFLDPTPLMDAVAKKLRELGYSARFETRVIQLGATPGSLPSQERRYGIFITW